METLLVEDECQTQKELALISEVIQKLIPHCLKSLGMFQKQENFIVYLLLMKNEYTTEIKLNIYGKKRMLCIWRNELRVMYSNRTNPLLRFSITQCRRDSEGKTRLLLFQT